MNKSNRKIKMRKITMTPSVEQKNPCASSENRWAHPLTSRKKAGTLIVVAHSERKAQWEVSELKILASNAHQTKLRQLIFKNHLQFYKQKKIKQLHHLSSPQFSINISLKKL